MSFKRRFLDFLMGGQVPTAPQKPLPEILTVPRIFANGRDDDSEGVKAFFAGKPYVFGDVLSPAGTDFRLLTGCSLRFSATTLGFRHQGRIVEVYGVGDLVRDVLIIDVMGPGLRRISGCYLSLGCEVQP